jgi:hypothetical protein
VNVIEQVPAATLAEQVLPAPSLTVTIPVGVPAPGGIATTVKSIVTAWPTTDGSGLSPIMLVVVLALFTVCDSAEDVLVVKLLSLSYAAVMLCGLPGIDRVAVLNVTCPEPFSAPVPTVVLPSLNVTVPLGVPLPGESAVTVAVNVTDCPKDEGFALEASAVAVLA